MKTSPYHRKRWIHQKLEFANVHAIAFVVQAQAFQQGTDHALTLVVKANRVVHNILKEVLKGEDQ